MPRNLVKVLDKNFSDIKAGQRMLISSPESVAEYIKSIPRGQTRTVKEMRLQLAEQSQADATCPVSTGIFLRLAIEQALSTDLMGDCDLPFWRVVDPNHPVVKKLGLDPDLIGHLREKEQDS